jgi:hypothetical protein
MKNVCALSGGTRNDPLDFAATIKPHLDAMVDAVAELARNRLNEEATR